MGTWWTISISPAKFLKFTSSSYRTVLTMVLMQQPFYSLSSRQWARALHAIVKVYHCYIIVIITGKHLQECVVPNIDIGLQSRWFWAMSITCTSFMESFLDFRSCWTVFIHVVRRHLGGHLQFSTGKLLKSSWHLFHLAFTQCGQTGRNAMPGAILRDYCCSTLQTVGILLRQRQG